MLWRRDGAGDTYEPADEHKPGDGDGWREGVEVGAVRRLLSRLGGDRKPSAGLAFTLECGNSPCNW